MDKIRILHVLKSMDIGGIETYIMNMYRNIDREKYQFDFLLWTPNETYYESEIINLGGNIYKFGFSKNVLKNMVYFNRFLKKNRYDVVHCHTHFYSGYFALASVNTKTKIFISHMHSKSDNKGRGLIRKTYRKIGRFLMNKYSTYCCACSEEAAIYGFGKNSENVIILKDYIDVNQYINVDSKRVQEIKQELGIKTNDFIVGNVGRLSLEKNQKYIVDIISAYNNQNSKIYNKNIKCLLIGDGPEYEKLQDIIKLKKLQKNFVFVGNVLDVWNYLKCINIFLFPSLYEGFGMALLEAQASGLICLASDNVPKNTDMKLGLVKYLPIGDKNIKKWIYEINNINSNSSEVSKERIKEQIIKYGFDVNSSLKNIEKMYIGDYKNE